MLRIETVKTKLGFRGRVAVYDNGKRTYAVLSEIDRLNRLDAMQDAARMTEDFTTYTFPRSK